MLLKTLLALYVELCPGADADIAEGLLLVLLLDKRPVANPERVLLVLLPVLPVSKGDKALTLCAAANLDSSARREDGRASLTCAAGGTFAAAITPAGSGHTCSTTCCTACTLLEGVRQRVTL